MKPWNLYIAPGMQCMHACSDLTPRISTSSATIVRKTFFLVSSSKVKKSLHSASTCAKMKTQFATHFLAMAFTTMLLRRSSWCFSNVVLIEFLPGKKAKDPPQLRPFELLSREVVLLNIPPVSPVHLRSSSLTPAQLMLSHQGGSGCDPYEFLWSNVFILRWLQRLERALRVYWKSKDMIMYWTKIGA